MRRGFVGFAVASVVGLVGACTPPVNPAGEPLTPTTAKDAFGGVQCDAVRPQTEPDLMAWDPGSRAKLDRLRKSGVVAVRYEAKGCNVEMELLSSCIGPSAKYEFSSYSANESKLARNAAELYAELPLGAAKLSGKIKGNKALRTDYMLAGQYALPPDATVSPSDLRGSDCARATHVVSAVYIGAFAMATGERREMEGRASLFAGVGAGASSDAQVELVADEGDAEACKESQKSHKESPGCAAPLRVALLPVSHPASRDARDDTERSAEPIKGGAVQGGTSQGGATTPSIGAVRASTSGTETSPAHSDDEDITTTASDGTFLSFESTPVATVFLDGKTLGHTPLMRRPVDPATHTVMFVNSEQLWKKTYFVTTRPGTTTRITARMGGTQGSAASDQSPPPRAAVADAPSQLVTPTAKTGAGYLNINSLPASTVEVDGTVIGPTPRLRFAVIPGTHVLRFTNAGEGLTKTVTVIVRKDEVVSVVGRLRD